ncbi:glycogen synthase GlgA [Mesobacillus foraminis]|uniref:glycogen synthase GlgA n=1 Tax=Mesobacillus foraminis TaxID=279826 RepID=UPI001BEA3819|nr:glycogen synthase GlgA [Mesobacillus foraminis]MBT2754343.1 glycogen synthase GlgA [Mesobacillus foraminis]
MKVLFAVSECVPFIKSGGLADVAGSLPKELKKLGIDVRVILPKYQMIPEEYKDQMKKVAEFTVPVGWRNQYCGIEELELDGVLYYFIDNEYYFKRSQMYGDFDEGEKFSYFNKAVLDSIGEIGFYPDVIHCHDWHTGMIPFLLKEKYQHLEGYESTKTVFTIHNLQFQGIFPKEILGDLLGLEDHYFNSDQLEFHGNVSFMKAALVSADKITTVSPTYMEEIQTAYFGENLDGVLRKRNADLVGILNGIDNDLYNPERDEALIAPFGPKNHGERLLNKLEIQKQFGLKQDEDIPLIAMVTRLTKQKGLELVRGVFHEIMATGAQLIVLGTGEREFEYFFSHMAAKYYNQCRVFIGFDEGLAHRIYAGADIFLMPSKFEPCGLSQLIALRYGAIPIVRETGGLNDTVKSYDGISGKGNGFTFTHFNAHDMLFTIERALGYYRDTREWYSLVEKVMQMDFSWAKSAQIYQELYMDLFSRSELHVFECNGV